MRKPQENPSGKPASRTWLAAHVPRMRRHSGEMMKWLTLIISCMTNGLSHHYQESTSMFRSVKIDFEFYLIFH